MTATKPRGTNRLTLIIFIIVHHDFNVRLSSFLALYLSKENLLQDYVSYHYFHTMTERPSQNRRFLYLERAFKCLEKKRHFIRPNYHQL